MKNVTGRKIMRENFSAKICRKEKRKESKGRIAEKTPEEFEATKKRRRREKNFQWKRSNAV